MSRLLIEDFPLMVSPRLAVAVGLNEAILLQQLHYWLSSAGKEREGRLWVYNTLGEWNEQFPFWGLNTVRRTISNLEEAGLLESTDRFNFVKSDRTKWYTINRTALDALDLGLLESTGHMPKMGRPYAQNGQVLESAQNGQVIPEKRLPTETSLKESAEQRGAAPLSESETSPSLEEPNTAKQGNPEKEATTLETVPPAAAKTGKEIRAEWLAEYRAFERPEWLADKPWREWLDVRTAKRTEPKVGALALMVRKLEGVQAQGYDPSEVLQIIADKGWTGYYDTALQDATPPTGVLAKTSKGRPNRPQTMQEANQKFIQGMADTKEAIRGVFDD